MKATMMMEEEEGDEEKESTRTKHDDDIVEDKDDKTLIRLIQRSFGIFLIVINLILWILFVTMIAEESESEDYIEVDDENGNNQIIIAELLIADIIWLIVPIISIWTTCRATKNYLKASFLLTTMLIYFGIYCIIILEEEGEEERESGGGNGSAMEGVVLYFLISLAVLFSNLWICWIIIWLFRITKRMDLCIGEFRHCYCSEFEMQSLMTKQRIIQWTMITIMKMPKNGSNNNDQNLYTKKRMTENVIIIHMDYWKAEIFDTSTYTQTNAILSCCKWNISPDHSKARRAASLEKPP